RSTLGLIHGDVRRFRRGLFAGYRDVGVHTAGAAILGEPKPRTLALWRTQPRLHGYADHFGGDLQLVVVDLVRAQEAVAVLVEHLEEGFRVGVELRAVDLAVVVLVHLPEPVGHRIGGVALCTEWL